MKVIKLKAKKGGTSESFEVRDSRHEFFIVDDEFIDKWARKVGPYATGVYLCLCRHADKEQSCWPSEELISDKIAISTRQIRRAIKALETHRLVKVSRSSGGSNKYHLTKKTEYKDPRPRKVIPIEDNPIDASSYQHNERDM